MIKCILTLGLALFLLHNTHIATAQSDSSIMRKYINQLTKPSMKGRGYVGGGLERAAKYIADEMSYYNLTPLGNNGYFHEFEMPINTFPNKMSVYLDYEKLKPGIDYLVDPFSSTTAYEDKQLKHVDMEQLFEGASADEFTTIWNKFYIDHGKDAYYVYVLHNVDAFKKMWGNRALRAMSQFLIEGQYIIPTTGKPLWYPAMNQEKFNIIYVFGSAIAKVEAAKMASAKINAQYIKQYKAKNVAGYIPARNDTKSFIVFTAHYDHLGMMGGKTRFDGANDNASGTSAMLTLMQHYAEHPLENHHVLFIACTAEEAGLIGAFRYADADLVNLKDIKFLINLDIWGDAKDGISVVNGKVFDKEFQWVKEANQTIGVNGKGFFKEIRQGEEAANSDHAPFYLKGVPSFFFFTMGGPGHYHHVADKANTLPMTNINQALKLVKQFVSKFEE